MKKDMLVLFIVMFVSLMIAAQWDKVPEIKETVGSILDPTFGALMEFNLWIGFTIIVGIISLILTLAQKYLSDQHKLKELRKEQKLLNEEIKKYRDHPEKLAEINKKQLEFIPKTFELTIKPLIYTSIPIILLFRWFADYLLPRMGGWWFLYYIIFSMILSSIFRKALDVA
jgi:uncharacterized membrane protein (DUF106 family)